MAIASRNSAQFATTQNQSTPRRDPWAAEVPNLTPKPKAAAVTLYTPTELGPTTRMLANMQKSIEQEDIMNTPRGLAMREEHHARQRSGPIRNAYFVNGELVAFSSERGITTPHSFALHRHRTVAEMELTLEDKLSRFYGGELTIRNVGNGLDMTEGQALKLFGA